jgi:hypothetical protein
MQWEMDDSEVAYGFAGLGDVWARNEMAVCGVCVCLTYSCCRIFNTQQHLEYDTQLLLAVADSGGQLPGGPWAGKIQP